MGNPVGFRVLHQAIVMSMRFMTAPRGLVIRPMGGAQGELLGSQSVARLVLMSTLETAEGITSQVIWSKSCAAVMLLNPSLSPTPWQVFVHQHV